MRDPDPEVAGIIQAEAERLGVVPRDWTDERIVERGVLALVREGAYLLERQVARCPSDIDVIRCNVYGFPRERVGPMFHGAPLACQHVLSCMREFAAEPGGEYWVPSAYVERLATSPC